MRVISVSLQNFASYATLDFDFTEQGLALIQGPTGSGKSTLCDAIPWILFGKTSKNGAVDEVLAWNAEEPTEGRAVLEVNGDSVWVTRRRGNKANDLVFYKNGVWECPIRGKDIPDTQRLINQALGIDLDLYLAGSYFHEFSQTAQFFITTAKNRRTITEQLVDLSLPKRLQEAAQAQIKAAKADLAKVASYITSYEAKIDGAVGIIDGLDTQSTRWEAKTATEIETLKNNHFNFDENKSAKIDTLEMQLDFARARVKPRDTRETQIQEAIESLPTTRCEHCNSLVKSEEKALLKQELTELQAYHRSIERAEAEVEKQKALLAAAYQEVNVYAERLAAKRKETNPFSAMIEAETQKLYDLQTMRDTKGKTHIALTEQIQELELLLEVVADFRSVLIKNQVAHLEAKTNALLTKHFDAEIRVELQTEAADKLEVQITKDGNLCAYTQLSKGQRRILNLCFGVAVMESVANHHGVKFHQAFFDEALDGLDENIKKKAFGLLQHLALSFESVFVVEHSENFKTLFETQYVVSLNNGHSQIEKS